MTPDDACCIAGDDAADLGEASAVALVGAAGDMWQCLVACLEPRAADDGLCPRCLCEALLALMSRVAVSGHARAALAALRSDVVRGAALALARFSGGASSSHLPLPIGEADAVLAHALCGVLEVPADGGASSASVSLVSSALGAVLQRLLRLPAEAVTAAASPRLHEPLLAVRAQVAQVAVPDVARGTLALQERLRRVLGGLSSTPTSPTHAGAAALPGTPRDQPAPPGNSGGGSGTPLHADVAWELVAAAGHTHAATAGDDATTIAGMLTVAAHASLLDAARLTPPPAKGRKERGGIGKRSEKTTIGRETR